MYPSHLQSSHVITFLLPRPLKVDDVCAAHESRSAADGPPQSEVDGQKTTQYIHLQRYLQRSNLQRSNLQRSNLQRSNLQRSNLQRSNLQRSNLQRSNLQRSNLQRSNLQRSNLQRSKRSNLQRSNLQRSTHPHRRASIRVIIA
jgi:hypothetical protein